MKGCRRLQLNPAYDLHRIMYITNTATFNLISSKLLLTAYGNAVGIFKSDSSHRNLDFENRRDPEGIVLSTFLLYLCRGKYNMEKYIFKKSLFFTQFCRSSLPVVGSCLRVHRPRGDVRTCVLNRIKTRSRQRPSIYLAQTDGIRRRGLDKSPELSIVVG